MMYMPHMKYVFVRVVVALLGAPLLLAPAVAYAETAPSLTADAGIGVSATASAANAEVTVFTRENVRAQPDANGNSTSTAAREAAFGTAVSAEAKLLRTRAAAILDSDAKVSAVGFSAQEVSLEYRQPARLFGFVPVLIPVAVTVNASGTATVRYPWYRFLLAGDEAGLAVKAQAAVDREFGTAGVAAEAGFSAAMQARLLDSLHATMENEFGTEGSVDASSQ
ncbi:TPA: hypothetical protein DIV48_03355 [Candidatus Kaiserbacteria bacterium]|nr:hypothetical protein [Candidatus Kaiserbacteria bacterium]